MWRRILSIVVGLVLMFLFAATAQAATQIIINGKPVNFDSEPIIEQGRVLVPLRATFEALNATLSWDAATQTINSNKDATNIRLTIGGEAYKNGQAVTLDVPARIVRGRTYVPVRFVSESLGAAVNWDNGVITINLAEDPSTNTESSTSDAAKSMLDNNNTQGNSVGNIVNWGLVAQSGGWIYYSSNDGNKLYKVRTDGSEKTKLNDDFSQFINVVGDWVYYRNADEFFKLYKIRTDGSERTKLNDDYCTYINVVGDWIYYTGMQQYKNTSNFSTYIGNSIYKIRTDGSERTKLSNNVGLFINVVGGWIYYQDQNNGKLYKISTDGFERTKLNDDMSFYINVVGDWAYYTNGDDGFKLYKVRTDGSERTKLNDHIGTYVNVAGDWVYYTGDAGRLYKIRTDGSGKTKLNDDISWYINIVDDWVYYTRDGFGGRLYRIRTDGSQRQLVE